MTELEVTSWIFLATTLASQKEPAGFDAISLIADGINHAVPTEKELSTSLTWLRNEGLILKQGKKYHLTAAGIKKYEEASRETIPLLEIWNNLDQMLTGNDFGPA